MANKNGLAESHHSRPQWRTNIGFILAAVGSAIGLGNIWRFSYLCYKNGGGAFLIPYMIALLIVGIPVMILELGLGHRMRGSAPMSLAMIDKKWEWVGWWSVIFVMYGIMMYYGVIIAWCLNYVFFSFNLSWGADANAFFFKEFLQLSSGPFEIGNIRFPIICSLMGIWFLCWLIVFFGVQNGVERANRIFMPLLFTLIIALVFWSVSLEGAMDGIRVYLKPDFSQLFNLSIWIDAFTQIFFTLSLGFGIMIAYASYLPRKADIVKDSIVICVVNCAFSFVAGFAVFGTLGYMANTMNVPVSEVVKESIGLAFVAYPQAISLMPAFKNLFGILFFSSLVIAGISSAISIVEAFASAVIDKFHYPRQSVVTFICFTGFLGSIIFTANSGLFWIDIVDHFITHYGLVIVGILECLVVGWVFRSKRLREHISASAKRNLSKVWDWSIKVVTPAILFFLLVRDLKTEISEPYEGYSELALILIGRDWLVIALFLALIFTMRPWKKVLEFKELT